MAKTLRVRCAWSPSSVEEYTRRRIERADGRYRRTLRAFAKWLADSRGLSPGTIRLRIDSASTFLGAVISEAGCGCAQAFRSITARQVEEFFVEYGKDHGVAARRSMRSAMCRFLEFASGRGWVSREMADAVPSVLGYRLSDVPRGVSDEDLTQLLSTVWEKGRCLLRDRAIVWLLATYGVRRHQVSALQLGDIDWHQRTLLFAAHKGGKAVQHVLTEPVAQTLADYLHEERPASECDYVFLRHRRPHVRLGPGAVSTMVRTRTQLCGLPPLYPHSLRHAFATRLLRAGQPVKVIADLLGHRSLATVSVYAKVDHVRLFEVAADWPEEAS